MSRTSGKGKHAVEGKEDMEDSELSEEEEPDDDEDDETDREETPDLYRNSSLGMYVVYLPTYLFCLTSRMGL